MTVSALTVDARLSESVHYLRVRNGQRVNECHGAFASIDRFVGWSVGVCMVTFIAEACTQICVLTFHLFVAVKHDRVVAVDVGNTGHD